MTLAIIVELLLSALLVLTLGYCALLERKLSLLRKGQDGLKETIAELNTAITNAGVSMRMLKTAAAGASEKLEQEIARGRGLADELAVLTASGERIADRIDRGSTKNGSPLSGMLATRLESLRPQLRSIR
jgi:phage shock protein A